MSAQQHRSSSLSSSSSSLSSPRKSSKSATSSSSEHCLPFVSLLNQSTIYRRHEARLARTYALRDDPRPAFLRVLSGLPLTRMIVPPYHEIMNRQNQHQTQTPNANTQQLGDYSEDTIFSKVDDVVANENSNNFHGISFSANAIPQHAMQALLAAGVGAILGESLFGGHYHGSRSTSPFSHHPQHYNNSRVSSLFSVRGHAADSSLGFQLLKNPHHARPIAATVTTTATTPSRMILLAASTTSLMFGAKVVTAEYLSQTTGNSSYPASTMISSALAGSVAGMFRLATTNAPTNLRQQLPSILTMTTHTSTSSTIPLLGRHVVAATLYFAIYDSLSSDSSTATTGSLETTSTPRIMTSGATAGIVYASILQSTSRSSGMRLLPIVIRAAPIHALVFYAYESMRQGMKQWQPIPVAVKPVV